jgi:iron complex transport system substrate-binding protein
VCAGLALVVGATAAGRTAEPSGFAANVSSGCVETFDAAADYFPDKATVEDAIHFSVTYHRSYEVVSVRDASRGASPER